MPLTTFERYDDNKIALALATAFLVDIHVNPRTLAIGHLQTLRKQEVTGWILMLFALVSCHSAHRLI
jgi:hypothetical protein